MVRTDVAQEKEELTSWLETERGDKIPLHALCTIGRGESNHIVLNTSAVSRHHAVIHERDKEFWIVDLGGVNGVSVNGTRVFQPVRLQAEDRIKMPSAVFMFRQGILPAQEAKPEQKPATPPTTPSIPDPAPIPTDVKKDSPQPTVAIPEVMAAPLSQKKGASLTAPITTKSVEKPPLHPTMAATPGPVPFQSDTKKESSQPTASFPDLVSAPSEDKKESSGPIAIAPATVSPPPFEQKDALKAVPTEGEGKKLRGRKKRRAEWKAKITAEIATPIAEKTEAAQLVVTKPNVAPDHLLEKKEPASVTAIKSSQIFVTPDEKIDVPPVVVGKVEPVHLEDDLLLPVTPSKPAPPTRQPGDAAKAPPTIMIKRPKPGAKVDPPRQPAHDLFIAPIEKKAEAPTDAALKTPSAPPAAQPETPPTIRIKMTPAQMEAMKAPQKAVPGEPVVPTSEEKKEPLKPTVVRPASASSWPEVKKDPPPLPMALPATGVAQPKEKAATPQEATPKAGPILIHPELIKDLPLAPAPILAAPPLEQKKEPAAAIISMPAIAVPEVKEKVVPPVLPVPVTIPVEELKVPKVEAKALPVPVQTEDKKVPEIAAKVTTLPAPAQKKEPPPLIVPPMPAKVPVEEKKDSPKEGAEKLETQKPIRPKTPRAVATTKAPAGEAASSKDICVTAKHSMYVGLASIFLPFLGFFTALFAIVLGHRALKIIKQSHGTLGGRDQAITGLYFGYITVVLIAGYSTFFYFLYASPSSASSIAANPPSMTLDTPSIEIPAAPAPPSSVPPATPAPNQKTQGTAPVALTPIHTSTPLSLNSATALSDQTPSGNTPVSLSPIHPSAPNTLPPLASTGGQDASTQPASDAKTPINTGTVPAGNPSLITLMDSSNQKGLSVTTSALAKAAAPEQPTPVFSYERQTRLKEEMLALPMPYENVDSTNYRDADAFNNSARLLARKPEDKYAQSVQDFIDDIKDRNPDRIRLQILMAMYQNYMAGLENGTSQ